MLIFTFFLSYQHFYLTEPIFIIYQHFSLTERNILHFLKLTSWSNVTRGIHYTFFYSLLFFIPAFMLGNRLKLK